LVAAGRSFAEVVRDHRSDPISVDCMQPSHSHPVSNCSRPIDLSPLRPTLPPRSTATLQTMDWPTPCSRCLAHGHVRSACVSKVHCLACYRYGHIKWNYLSRSPKTLIFHIKRKPPEITPPVLDLAVPSSSGESSTPPLPPSSP
jgi:hypothetical protein